MAEVPDTPQAKTGKAKRAIERAEPKPDSPRRKRTAKTSRTRAARAAKAQLKPSAGNEADIPRTPVMIRAEPTDDTVLLSDEAAPNKARRKSGKRLPGRRRPQQTFLVAATSTDDRGTVNLGVYAIVTRTSSEALSAVRDLLGAAVPVGLTGKLSGRMAKALGLRPGEVRRL